MSKRITLATLVVALGTPLFARDARADNTAIVYAVDDFSDFRAGRCGDDRDADMSSAHDLPDSVDMAAKVYGVLDDWKGDGDWDAVHEYTNSSVLKASFLDQSRFAAGADGLRPGGLDVFDVAFISTHGFSVSAGGKYYSALGMGSTTSGCLARTNLMRFGNAGSNGVTGDLDVLITYACQSVQREVYENDGYDVMNGSGDAYRLFLGFHGSSWSGHKNDVEDYFEGSRRSGIGSHWLSELYAWGYTSSTSDSADREQCPTAVIWGDSSSSITSFYRDSGLGSRSETGSKTHKSMHWLSGCDPKNGSPLPE